MCLIGLGDNMLTVLDNGTSVVWEFPQNKEMIYAGRLPELKDKPVYDFLKRLFDLLISFMMLVILTIPMALIALIIVLDSSGNPVYSQVRLGLGERPFKIYKFRTMIQDAESDGMRWAEYDDERVTKVGSFLRKSRLDELPQLWNILIGDMSFVGPRPERPEFYDIFDTYIDGYRQRMVMKPGLTGLAQVNGGYDLRPEEKIVYDLQYICTRTVGMDLRCIYKTIRLFFTHEGAR